MSGLNQVFESCFSEHAAGDAIHTADGQTLSFARVGRAAAQIAHGMAARGVGPGDNVICLVGSFAINLCTWFAVWRLGCNLLASNAVENFAGSGVAIDAALIVPGQEAGPARPLLFDQSWLEAEAAPLPPAEAGSIYFPTTLTPRELSVLRMSAAQMLADARLYADTLGPGRGAVYMSTPVDSMRSFRDVFRAFLSGRPVLGPDLPLDAAWPAIRKFGARELFVAPMSMQRLTAAAAEQGGQDAIERIFVATGTAQQKALKRTAEVFRAARIELGAGTPETSLFAYKPYDPESHRTGQIGTMVRALRAEIRDAEGRALPPGETGALAIWVPPAARLEGYLNRRPAYDPDGWCSPGFLASMDEEGNVTKLGRTDDRINIGGARFFSGKIEAAIDLLPTVARSAAIRVFGPDGAEAMGIVIEPGEGFDADSLRAILDRGFRFVGDLFIRTIDRLPVDAGGNPDRRHLEEIWDQLSQETGPPPPLTPSA